MAKKSSRLLVGMVCEESGIVDYVTVKNKVNTTTPLRMKKYSRTLRKHTWHKETKKLD